MCGFDHLIGDREQNLVREDLKADVRMLIITPMREELDFFLRRCKKKGFQAEDAVAGRLPIGLTG